MAEKELENPNVLANPSEVEGEANSEDNTSETTEIAAAPAEPRKDNVESPKTEGTTPESVDPDKGRWYVVHTYSGHEAKVAATLKQKIKAQGMEQRIFEILVPTQE